MKKKIIGFIILLLGFWILLTADVSAASFSVTSSRSLTVGGTSSITITANSCGGKFTISSSDSSVVSVSTSSIWVESGSSTVKITAKKAGTATITVRASDVASTDGETEITGSKTCRVTVSSKSSSSSGGGSSSGGSTNRTTTTEQEKSSDATLSALTVKEGTISPEFSKDVEAYTLTVPNEITQINVTATPTDSKATVKVEGNKDLKEGENPVTVTVTAEDGTTAKYTINVTRERAKLSLQTLVIKYQNQNGEQIEIPLNPVFNFETTEYTLQDLEYWVEKLDIEAKANLEGATINIEGSENLQIGENTITITVKMPAEVQENAKETEEAPKEETIIYTIKVIKKEEPTLIAKISDWFKGIFGGITAWYNNNTPKIILGALGVCIIALLGLSIYIVIDYNKYKDIIKNVKKVSQINTTEVETENILEQIHSNINKDNENIETKTDNNIVKPKGGKHF